MISGYGSPAQTPSAHSFGPKLVGPDETGMRQIRNQALRALPSSMFRDTVRSRSGDASDSGNRCGQPSRRSLPDSAPSGPSCGASFQQRELYPCRLVDRDRRQTDTQSQYPQQQPTTNKQKGSTTMSNELALALSNEVECNDRYKAPPATTRAGARDRRHERNHALAIRDIERNGREEVAGSALFAVRTIARMEALARVNTEAKYIIERGAKETQIIGADNPVVQTKCEILDDDNFNAIRPMVNQFRQGPARLF